MWLLGVATGVFLMMIDELINLSLYCGARCQYPIPLIGPLGIWDAWSHFHRTDHHHARNVVTSDRSIGINR
jgi:hypothetical protein